LEDKNRQKFLGAGLIDCKLKKVDVANKQFVIDSLIFTEPYVYFELEDSTNNLYEIFNVNFTEEDSAIIVEVTDSSIDPASGSLFYAVNYLAIRNGSVDYTDVLTGEPFDYYLSEIELSADSIISTSDWVNTYSTMMLNNRGKLVAEAGFDPANPNNINLDYVITDFLLSDLNIYSRHYMGFPILYGDMYYKGQVDIVNNQLVNENKLVIHNAELGSKRGGLYDLPLKFALFLLKDRHGVIDLDIPVRGDLDDPSVSVGKIIWQTFKNLIVKVAAAPFDFLAGLISVDPKDIKAIGYEYADTVFSPKIQKQLDLLLELEQKKEGLDIELVYFNDVDEEKVQVAIFEAGKIFNAETGKEFRNENKLFVDFLTTKTNSDTLDIAQASLSLIKQNTLDSLVNLFAKTRKDNIEKYLTTVSDSTNIRLFIPDPKSPKNVGSKPLFEVKYSMKED